MEIATGASMAVALTVAVPGPGFSGTREGAQSNPQALYDRLVALSRNMMTTITAMATSDSSVGASR